MSANANNSSNSKQSSRLFIASASENLDAAYALQENSQHFCDPTVWTQSVFQNHLASLESLFEATAEFDFAVFVFTPIDVIQMRDSKYNVARDNIVFELGLFMGKLGRERCFIISPQNTDLDFKLPSDLLGITPIKYNAQRDDNRLDSALGPASNYISKRVAELGRTDHSHNFKSSPNGVHIYGDGNTIHLGKDLRPQAEVQEPLDNIERLMCDHVWRFVFDIRAGLSKIMTFGPSGQISKGQNRNESSWQVKNHNLLEFIRSDGALQNQFKYDKSSGTWNSTEPKPYRALSGQKLIKVSSVDPFL